MKPSTAVGIWLMMLAAPAGAQEAPGPEGAAAQAAKPPCDLTCLALALRPEAQAEIHLDMRHKDALTRALVPVLGPPDSMKPRAAPIVMHRSEWDMVFREFSSWAATVQLALTKSPDKHKERMYHAMAGASAVGWLAAKQDIADYLMRRHLEAMATLPQAVPMTLEQAEAHLATVQQDLLKDLEPEQKKRLVEISLQVRGPLALADADVAKEAGLEAAHQQAIGGIAGKLADEAASVWREMFPDAPADSSQHQEMLSRQAPTEDDVTSALHVITRKRTDAESAILAVLSAEEGARWTAMQGTPFHFRGTPRADRKSHQNPRH